MGAYRKADIRRLTSEVYQLDGHFTQGILHRNPDDGRWMVGSTPLHTWLERYEGEDLTVMVIPTTTDSPTETKTCRTCGRTYTGPSCPHCREVRIRLRGR